MTHSDTFCVKLSTKFREMFTIFGEYPIMIFSLLKAPTFTFTLTNLIRHNAEQMFKHGPSWDLLWKLWIFREISMTPLMPTHSAQYCLLAALLLHALPHDGTYVAVAGLFLAMKVASQTPDCLLLTLHLSISQVGPLFGVPVDLFSPLENKVRRIHCSVY